MALFLHEIMAKTAWGMTPPKAYGAFHLGFFFGGLLISVLLALLLRKSKEKTFRGVMLFCGIFLLVTEIYKQLFYVFYVDYTTPVHYVWWIFPFQLCSVPMYFCIAIGCLKPCKAREWMCDFLLAFNLMSGFITFLEPSGLVHEYWTLTLHAFIWHMMLVFIGLYIGFSRHGGRKLGNYIHAAVIFVILSVIALGINFAFWDISGQSIKMFYVGPGISPLIVFKDIATVLGWYVNTPIYVTCLCIAAFVFYLPFALWNRKKDRKEAEAASLQKG